MKILVLGDAMGLSGRLAIKKHLSKIISENEINFTIINGENAADDGKGITKEIVDEFFSLGIDVITSGNHIWDKEETARKLYQGKMACVEQGRHIGGGVPYGYELIQNGRHKYLREIPEQQAIIDYVDKSLARHKAKGRKTPWRSISKQIKSLEKQMSNKVSAA